MGKLEALQKRIDQIADKARHLRYMLFGIISAVVALIFGVSQNKFIENAMTNSLFVVGTILIIVVSAIIRVEEEKRTKLIKKLEGTKE